MTALADLLTVADRQRLEDRLAEWRELDREMRRPGLLPGSAEPPPLHRAGRTTKNFSTESTKNFSTNPTKRTRP